MTTTPINILSADCVGDYRIRLRFDDGTEQTIDFQPFLSRSQHPDIQAYRELSRFARYRIEHGELVWGDYDLCVPIMDLHNNHLERGVRQAAA